jgi:hypothetical protein
MTTPSISRIVRLAELVSENRIKVTREALAPPDVAEWPTDVRTAGSFKLLVSELYKWTHETWGSEIRFLCDRAAAVGVVSTAVRQFTGLVVDLRTAQEHTSGGDARRHAERWFVATVGTKIPSADEQWSECATRLLASCVDAMSGLVGVAKAVAADPDACESWARAVRAAIATDPKAQRSIVAADLGLSLSRKQQEHVDREIAWAWGHRQRALTAADDADLELSRIVEKALVGFSLNMLPCQYVAILDLVDAGPGASALGALRLAHAFADLLAYSSEEDFLEQFGTIWARLEESGSV